MDASAAPHRARNDRANSMTQIRDLLFGDLPSDAWPSDSELTAEPWATFVSVRQHNEAGETDAARNNLHQILQMNDLESRHYLQAWHFLRSLGDQPSADTAKHLYGVVVEVALDGGVDIVAAYEDYSARYYNYAGAGIVWEHPNDSLNMAIDKLLSAGREVLERIGPWEGERPPAPVQGEVRINLLAPSGLHFGQGPYEALTKDQMGGPVIAAAFGLMQLLIESQAA